MAVDARSGLSSRTGGQQDIMKILAALLVLWLVFAVLGFLIDGLFWLAILGLLFFVVTAAWGAMRRRGSRMS